MELFDPQHLQEVKLVMPEHNRHGQDASYQENKGHFKTQTEIVDEHLKKEPVTSLLMMKLYGIIDTRARIYALKKSGRKIGERKIVGGKGSKEWFLIKEQ